ncbi:MAG: MBL fold metallo-hydrolase, partial [Actinomycetota bacterium]
LGAAAVLVLLGARHLRDRGAVHPWPAVPAVTALDVGQGDAILLRSPDGAAALIDTGAPGDPAAVLGALRREGVRELSLVAVTHDQLDHSGALREVLDHHAVGILAHPPLGPDATGLRRTVDRARAAGVVTREVSAGARIVVGRWTLDVMSPRAAPPAGADPNPYSMVVRARAGRFAALLAADAESDALAGLPLGSVDVLKVSHHGSADAGLARLLPRLRPAVALVSVGEGNPYGHPRGETLAALRAAGVRTWRTDRDGNVTVAEAADGLAVDAEG